MATITKILIFLLLTTLITSCGKKKRDSLTEEQVIQIAERVNRELPEENQRRIGTMANTDYHLKRSEDNLAIRLASIKRMEKADKLEEKKIHAENFFRHLEFQLWTDGRSERDTPEFREDLQQRAVVEFFSTLAKYDKTASFRLPVISFLFGKDDVDNEKLNILALALTLEEINTFQHEISKKSENGFQVVSMFDVIRDALLKNYISESDRDIQFTKAEEEILYNSRKTLFLDLFKIRLNYLTEKLIINSTPDRQRGLGRFLSVGGILDELNRINPFNRKWNSGFTSLNKVTQERVIVDLKKLIEITGFMASIGESFKADDKKVKIIKNMRTVSCDGCQEDDPVLIYRNLVNQFLGTLEMPTLKEENP